MRVPELDHALEWARRGDPDGFRQIYRALSPVVMRVLHALNPAEAEDLASETWMAVAKGLSGFQGDASGLTPWVLTIARNRHRDQCRRSGRRPATTALADGFDPPAPHCSDPAAVMQSSAETARALALVRRLPARQAEVIVLRVLVGLDVAEVARITDQRPGTVRVLAHRGLRTLSGYLAEGSATGGDTACNAQGTLDALRVT